GELRIAVALRVSRCAKRGWNVRHAIANTAVDHAGVVTETGPRRDQGVAVGLTAEHVSTQAELFAFRASLELTPTVVTVVARRTFGVVEAAHAGAEAHVARARRRSAGCARGAGIGANARQTLTIGATIRRVKALDAAPRGVAGESRWAIGPMLTRRMLDA